MPFEVLMLLLFAVWTVTVLLLTVGVYRWSNILTGRKEIKSFRGDAVEGADWYKRAMRAHANCVENLPVFAVVVFALYVSGISTAATATMAGVVVAARVLQSIVHVAFAQTNAVVFIRFLFFLAQLVCFLGMAVVVLSRTF